MKYISSEELRNQITLINNRFSEYEKTKIGNFELMQEEIEEDAPIATPVETCEEPVREYIPYKKPVVSIYSKPVTKPPLPRKKNETWAMLEEQFAENWTVGRKVSDRFTVPICRLHHHELIGGNERPWRQRHFGQVLPACA